jgi:hypothetical protein
MRARRLLLRIANKSNSASVFVASTYANLV